MSHSEIVQKRLLELKLIPKKIDFKNVKPSEFTEEFNEFLLTIGSSKNNAIGIISKQKLAALQVAGLSYILDIEISEFNTDQVDYERLLDYKHVLNHFDCLIYSAGQDLKEFLQNYFEKKSDIISRAKDKIYIFHTLDEKYNNTSEKNRSHFISTYYPMLEKYCEVLYDKKRSGGSKVYHKVIFQLSPEENRLIGNSESGFLKETNIEITILQRILELMPIQVISYFEKLFSEDDDFQVYYMNSPILQDRFTLVDDRLLIRDSSLQLFEDSPLNIMEIMDLKSFRTGDEMINSFSAYFEDDFNEQKTLIERDDAQAALQDFLENLTNEEKEGNQNWKRTKGKRRSELKIHLNIVKRRIENIEEKLFKMKHYDDLNRT